MLCWAPRRCPGRTGGPVARSRSAGRRLAHRPAGVGSGGDPGGGLSAPGALHRAHTDPGWSAARHQDVPHTIERHPGRAATTRQDSLLVIMAGPPRAGLALRGVSTQSPPEPVWTGRCRTLRTAWRSCGSPAAGACAVSGTTASCSALADEVLVVALAAGPVQGANDRSRVVVGAGHVERHAVPTEGDPAGLRPATEVPAAALKSGAGSKPRLWAWSTAPHTRWRPSSSGTAKVPDRREAGEVVCRKPGRSRSFISSGPRVFLTPRQ